MIKALQFFLSLSLLVFIHELGHFMWSRFFHVRVERFFIFFDIKDKVILSTKQTPWLIKLYPKMKDWETEYGIGWFPFGGYCKIAGMVDESMDKEQLAQEPKPWEFRTQSAFKRFMIMVGGVLNNVILAVIIYAGMMWHWGDDVLYYRDLPHGMTFNEYAEGIGFEPGDVLCSMDGKDLTSRNLMQELLLGKEMTLKRNGQMQTIALPDTMGEYLLEHQDLMASFAFPRYPMVVASVVDDGGAKAAGVQVGDSVIAVNGQPTPFQDLVKSQLKSCAGDTVTLTLVRAGEPMTLQVPVSSEASIGIGLSMSGISAYYSHIDYNLLTAIPAGISRGYDVLVNYIRQFKLVFTPAGAKSVGGFATMGSIFPSVWNWYAFWSLTAFFSVALAFMNILPIPALDGGHIVFLLYEVVTRRKPSDHVLEVAQYIGFFIIVALMLLANGNDIYRFLIKPFIG